MAFALFVESGDVADVEILATELGGEAADLFRFQQPPRLGGEDRVVAEPARSGESTEFVVGRGGGQEITQARRQFPVAHRTGRLRGLFAAIEKGR